MPRVLVLNNYPLERVWNEVRSRSKPDHHLFGINYFHERDYDVQVIPFEASPLWLRIDKLIDKCRIAAFLGCLDQQRSAWRTLHECDLIYSPCQAQTQILSYLRAIGWLCTPIVSIAHHPLIRGRFSGLRSPWLKLMIKGTDSFPSLSRKVAKEVNDLAKDPEKSKSLQWGPDATYYPKSPSVGNGVVAAGRTGRDFELLGLAASKTNVPTRIVCPQTEAPNSAAKFSRNVQLDVLQEAEALDYEELCKLFKMARVLAIPLVPGAPLSGLTGLMDALGMGKPVIMTRHPLIDLDIEAEGFGKWVSFGDVNGWSKAIEWFQSHSDEAAEMGRRARALVDNGLNSRAFAYEVMDTFDTILGRRPRGRRD